MTQRTFMSAAGTAARCCLLLSALAGCAGNGDYWAETASRREPPYARWKYGPPTDPAWFPIGVSTQEPSLYGDYRAAYVNLAMRLWDGPTEAQLAELKKYPGVRTICHQNGVGLAHITDPLIAGWTLHDEPDNAQSMKRYWKNDLERIAQAWPGLPDTTMRKFAKGSWGPPVPPAEMIAAYEAFNKNDPDRPVRLNLGVGIADEKSKSRGIRSGHMEDYEAYVRAGDIISFDVYPLNDMSPYNNGKFWRHAVGLRRIRELTGNTKPVWNYIETTRIIKAGRKPNAHQMRSQVWISLIHGSEGIMYFAHGVHPEDGSFWDMALHNDKAQLDTVGQLSAEVLSLAPVLNRAELGGRVAAVESSVPASAEMAAYGLDPVALSCRYYDGCFYLFAARMEDSPSEASFTLTVPEAFPADTQVEVLGEDRSIVLDAKTFNDAFAGYGVHLYRVRMLGD